MFHEPEENHINLCGSEESGTVRRCQKSCSTCLGNLVRIPSHGMCNSRLFLRLLCHRVLSRYVLYLSLHRHVYQFAFPAQLKFALSALCTPVRLYRRNHIQSGSPKVVEALYFQLQMNREVPHKSTATQLLECSERSVVYLSPSF